MSNVVHLFKWVNPYQHPKGTLLWVNTEASRKMILCKILDYSDSKSEVRIIFYDGKQEHKSGWILCKYLIAQKVIHKPKQPFTHFKGASASVPANQADHEW